MTFSLTQQKALAWAPRLPACLSVLASGHIAFSVLRDNDKRSATYHRLLCSMSCFDVLSSVWYALSTLPIPEGTEDVFGAEGNRASCTAQGFFIQVGSVGAHYNHCLSFYYFSVIYRGERNDCLKRKEPLMHLYPVLLGLGTAIAGLPLEIFNSADLWCWIASVPQMCDHKEDVECVRGNNANRIYRWAFFFVIIWFDVLHATVHMIMCCWKVRQQEKSARKWRMDEDRSRNARLSRRTAAQAVRYLIVFYVTWLPYTALRTIEYRYPSRNKSEYFWLYMISAILLPSQGCFSFLVYRRPKLSGEMLRQSADSLLEAARKGMRLRQMTRSWNAPVDTSNDELVLASSQCGNKQGSD